MAVETFLAFWMAVKFLYLAACTFQSSRPVCSSLSVFMPSCSVAVDTREAFADMKAMREIYDPFLELIAQFENLAVAVQASLRSQIVISNILGGNKLVSCGLKDVPSSRDGLPSIIMTLCTACLIGRMAFRAFPEIKDLLVALCTDLFIRG